MATSTFDKNFERLKSDFKAKYQMEWSADKALYTQFVQLHYVAAQAEVLISGLNAIAGEQTRMTGAITFLGQQMQRS